MSQDITEWKWSYWTGSIEQLASGAELAEEKIHALVPYPARYNPNTSKYDPRKQRQYGEAADAHRLLISVAEKGGYTGSKDTLEELKQLPQQTLKRATSVNISLGSSYKNPSVAIRASNRGLSVEIVGPDRTWTAGLRHELEDVLRPTQRMHAPLMNIGGDPFVATAAGLVASYLLFSTLHGYLTDQHIWMPTTRLWVCVGAGVCSVGVLLATGWASAKRFELLPEGEQGRYERWRKILFAAAGALLIGVVSSAIVALLSAKQS